MSEILDDFLVFKEEGLYCKYGDFYLDAQKPVKRVLVSHGHADHTIGGCLQVYATAPTLDFMGHRYGKNVGKSLINCTYKDWFFLNEVAVCFYPAGHILGSAAIFMQYKERTYLYTGDYKLQEDATCEAAELPIADVLITESTFANPATQHPDPIIEVQKLNETSHPIMLGAYALGKAQRLTYLINKYCTQKQLFIHHSILPYHRIYESRGITLGNYQAYNRRYFKEGREHLIYLVPPLTFRSYYKAKNLVKAFASGWTYLQTGNNIAVYISDHVDWKDILQVVEVVRPKEIWTLHGDGRQLANFYLNSLKVKHL